MDISKYLQMILTQKNIMWLIPHLFAFVGIIGSVQMLKEIFDPKKKMKALWKGLVIIFSFLAAFGTMHICKIKFDWIVWLVKSLLYASISSWLYSNGKSVKNFIKMKFINKEGKNEK